jgi:hypothetical protein
MLSLIAALCVFAWRKARAQLRKSIMPLMDYADLRCAACWAEYEATGEWTSYSAHRAEHAYTPQISPDDSEGSQASS